MTTPPDASVVRYAHEARHLERAAIAQLKH